MLLLSDWSHEIPAFLQRNADGTFRWPNMKYLPIVSPMVVANTRSHCLPLPSDVSATKTLDRWGLPINEQDEKVKRLIELDEKREITDNKVAGDKVRREAKSAEKARMLANKLKQRKVFIKHFKWDFNNKE
jgi:hypothetical protein